jgi:anti-sigma B factor antagonist
MGGEIRVMPHAETFPTGEGAFSLRIEPHGDAVRVRAFGELDLATTQRFEADLRQELSNGHTTVVLDLSAVEFIDSTGLSAIFRMANEAKLNGGRFRIRRELSPPVERVFDLAGCRERLPFAD